jgi:hypothetical protein
MNIPLDNLYHWIQNLAQHPVILYVFRPHGSKDIFDLNQFEHNPSINYGAPLAPVIICHDQEILDFSSHKFEYSADRLQNILKKRNPNDTTIDLVMMFYSNLPMFPNFKPSWLNVGLFQDWSILLHSEQNSPDVEQFSQVGFLPVYYWSHAMIARDWYRFAEHDIRLEQRHVEKTFLVYCRDWTPKREYRLKFLDLLISAELVNDCVISTQHTNNQGVHLLDYQIQDPRFLVDTKKLLCIPDNNSLPCASADYDVKDIVSTAVSVVLETVVDGVKIHLTEKILRPIACSHPFVIIAGPGALAYLQRYGFLTFGDIWDESYDHEPDTVKRMEMIIQTMKQIQQLSESDWKKVNAITEYNKQHFFSEKFMAQITDELQTNLNSAVDCFLIHRGEIYWAWRKFIRRAGMTDKNPFFKNDYSKKTVYALRQHRLLRSRNGSSPVIGQ